MVILYNKKLSNFSAKFKTKSINKNGNKVNFFSNKLNSKKLTPSNRKFLLSLGFKLK